LHLNVARLLLHRGNIQFARAVLGAVPRQVRADLPSLAPAEKRLGILTQANELGALVPASMMSCEWWTKGPFLVPTQHDKRELVEWYAARVDEVRDQTLHLRVATIPYSDKGCAGALPPPVGHLAVDQRDLQRWLRDWEPDADVSAIAPGQFLELGKYAAKKSKGKAVLRARLRKPIPWDEDELPRLWLDPARYLRRTAARG
jgi:hypothetical protein